MTQERIGDWIHCEKGWLPLCIGLVLAEQFTEQITELSRSLVLGEEPVFEVFTTFPEAAKLCKACEN